MVLKFVNNNDIRLLTCNNLYVYNDTKPTHVLKVFSDVDSVILLLICFVLSFKVNLIVLKLSMRLHFLDVHVNCQVLKGNKQ